MVVKTVCVNVIVIVVFIAAPEATKLAVAGPFDNGGRSMVLVRSAAIVLLTLTVGAKPEGKVEDDADMPEPDEATIDALLLDSGVDSGTPVDSGREGLV